MVPREFLNGILKNSYKEILDHYIFLHRCSNEKDSSNPILKAAKLLLRIYRRSLREIVRAESIYLSIFLFFFFKSCTISLFFSFRDMWHAIPSPLSTFSAKKWIIEAIIFSTLTVNISRKNNDKNKKKILNNQKIKTRKFCEFINNI